MLAMSQSMKSEGKTPVRPDVPNVKVPPRSAGALASRASITGLDVFHMLPEHVSTGRRRSSVLTDELAAFKMSVRPESKGQTSLTLPMFGASPGTKRKSISDVSVNTSNSNTNSNPTPMPPNLLAPWDRASQPFMMTPVQVQVVQPTVGPQQYVLERPPKLMKMVLGDHYMVPHAATSLRFDVCFTLRPDVGDLEVDINAISFTSTGKKHDHCSLAKRSSKDKALQHLGDEKIPGGYSEKGESVVVSIPQLHQDVTTIFITLSVSSAGRYISDFEKLHVRCVETGLFPGSPELFRFVYQPNRIKQTGVGFFALTRETITRSPGAQPVAVTPAPGKKKGGPVIEVIHLWTAKAVGVELIQRSLKLVSLDCEDATRRIAAGWLPIPKGMFQVGGDMSRIVSDRMMKKALKKADENSVSRSEKMSNASSEDDDTDSRDGRSKHTGRESVDTATPVEQMQLEFESLFVGGASKNGQGRPRVVRRNKRVYSVGRAVKVTEHHNRSSDDDDGSDDDDLFRQVFTKYASRKVVRYDDKCYNIGTYKEMLLQHYLEHKEEYEATTKHIGDVFAKAPLVVDCVVDEEEDLANLICPPMELDPLSEEDVAAIKRFNTDHSVISVAGLPLNLSPRGQDLEAGPGQAANPLDLGPLLGDAPLLDVQPPADGGRQSPRLNGLRPAPLWDAPGLPSAQQSPGPAPLRFGRLKPQPPIQMQQMRVLAEKKKHEEEEAVIEAQIARERSAAKANRRKSLQRSNSLTADQLMRRGTVEMMKISTQPQKQVRPSDIMQQITMMSGARAKKKKAPQFSGELQSWINAHQLKEMERKTTYGRTGRSSLSPTDTTHLPSLMQQQQQQQQPASQKKSPPMTEVQSTPPHPPASQSQRSSSSVDPVLSSEHRALPPAAPLQVPPSREGRRTSVQFQFGEPDKPLTSVASDRSTPDLPDSLRTVLTRKSLR